MTVPKPTIRIISPCIAAKKRVSSLEADIAGYDSAIKGYIKQLSNYHIPELQTDGLINLMQMKKAQAEGELIALKQWISENC